MSKFDENKKAKLTALWNSAVIRQEKMGYCKNNIDRILKSKSRYELVASKTGCPWYVIACIHTMESDCDFKTHLHNGDPLSARTYHVPANRPKIGNPPFTWEESAIDALGYDGFLNEKDWSIEHILYLFEKYNGFGYESHGCLSTYVWAGSSVQTKGRYVADGKFDPDSWCDRVGCAAMLKMLISMKEVVIDETPKPQPEPIPEPIPEPLNHAIKFVEFFNAHYDLVRKDVEHWFAGKYSPTAVKNGCVAHQWSALNLCKLPVPKQGSMESINVDYFFAWCLKNGWSKITDMDKLQAGDICVSGSAPDDFDHVYCFVSYKTPTIARVLHNQQFGLCERYLKGGSCGQFRFAVRMP